MPTQRFLLRDCITNPLGVLQVSPEQIETPEGAILDFSILEQHSGY